MRYSRGWNLSVAIVALLALALATAACDSGGGDEGGGGADVGGATDTGGTGGGGDVDTGGGQPCADECDTPGALDCDADGAVVTCGDHDGDACLEWGGAAPCSKGACVLGRCVESCEDECDTAGGRRCDGDTAQRCGDHDDDPCLEWGGDEDCGAAQCIDGYCGVACVDDCTTVGARQCADNAVQTCGDHDADPCLEWGGDLDCGAAACVDGFCNVVCDDDCDAAGETRCDGNAVQTCGNHDGDPCLEWGGDSDCGELVCASGVCMLGCDAACTTDGARRCNEGGFQVCSNYDADPCLEWGTTTDCPAGQTCSNGHCRADCVDECTVVNARRCDGPNAFATCGNYDADGCLEWGTAVNCATGEVCSNGFCTTTCTSECTVLGARRCNGDAVQTCADANVDGCLEWSTPDPCGAAESCSNGFCATGCTSECTVSGAVRCSGDAIQTCGDADEDGCLEWGTAVPCGVDETCSNGYCATGCASECTVVGAKQCSGDAVQICGDADEDGCLEWGTAVPCGVDETCSNGHCASDCVNECTAVGARVCQNDAVQTCDDYDGDPCLEWGTPAPCPGGQICSNGFCALDCENACTLDGAQQCASTGAYQVCSDHDADGCLEWGTPVGCEMGETCAGGSCVSGCVSECTYIGARQCDGAGVGYRVCGDANDDDCLEWGSVVACPDGTTCSAGQCTLGCADECTVQGGRQCDGTGLAYQVCDDHDADGCLEWGSATPCDAAEVCSGGNCAVDCADECDIAGQRQCNVAGTGYQVCQDHDTDGCLEWGSDVPCEGDLVCASGNCAATCENACGAAGATRCNTPATGVETCGDYNDDGCLEWGTASPCGETETCADGACAPLDPPGTVVISEVYYDDDVSDDNTFVELYGDPGLDLTGFVLVGVNGSNNQDYKAVALDGSIPADGFYVVAHPDAAAAIAAEADQTADVDYQNGPDSVQLRWGAAVVDAVGYGTFPAGTFFAGEGTAAQAAPDAAPGASVARDADETDTNVNVNDFAAMDPTPGTWNGEPNVRPTAALVCPTNGAVGESLTFDAGGSSDADGTIVEYAFAFGDAAASSGPSPTTLHVYNAPDTYTVTLTVTDNRGGTGIDSCTLSVADADAPQAVIVRPMEDLQITQGDELIFEVDATPGPGRDITQVELLADGQVVAGPDDQIPYRFTYIVPAEAVTESTIVMQARATDDQGALGLSAPRNLLVRNDPPVATFAAVITGNLQVTVDASGVTDRETATADLEVRFDWESDGTFDTAWSTEKSAVHLYGADGEHTITMEVRDAVDQVTAATRTVDFQLVQDVYGELPESTLWMGTINITGDTWLPSGKTLRIASGTTVVFYYVDENGDGVGDYDLTINGTISVEGTQENPVIFTVLGPNEPGSWNSVIVNGTADSTFDWAIFEYADRGLTLNRAAALANCEFRSNEEGLRVANGSGTTTLTDCSAHDNAGAGVHVVSDADVVATGLTAEDNGGIGVFFDNGGVVVVDDCVVTGNGAHGFRIDDTAADVSNCDVTYNGETGFYLNGGTSGTITQNQIKYNAHEGLRALPNGSSNPSSSVNWNNIFGNGDEGSLVIESASVSASTSAGDYGPETSATWSTPDGERIAFVEASYSEYDYGNDISGGVQSGGGNTFVTWTSAASRRWQDIRSRNSSSVRAFVSDTSYSYYGSASIYRVAYVKSGATRQVTSLLTGGTLDVRHNYFGIWPDLLPALTYDSASQLDIEGFVGAAFDDTWSPGNYRGGETIAADETWDADTFVTGNVTVASGATLTIAAGVTVTFVPTDQGRDNYGDWAIDRGAGALTVTGGSGNPVLFTALGEGIAMPPGGGFRWVGGSGGGSLSMAWAVVEKADIGVYVTGGSATLADVTVRDNVVTGLRVTGSASLTSQRLTATGSGAAGVRLEGNGLRSFDGLTARENGSWGVEAVNARHASSAITNATLTLNAAGGVYLDRSQIDVTQSNLTYNGFGVRLRGNSAGVIEDCNIKYNAFEGVYAGFYGSADPTNVINNNNIFGNATEEAGLLETINLSVSTSAGNYGPYDSSTFAPGAGIEYLKASYSEYDYGSDVTGRVVGGSSTVVSWTSASSAQWYDLSDQSPTSVYANVNDTSYSYYGSTTISRVFYRTTTEDPPRVVELAAVMRSATLDCQGNYWGEFTPDNPVGDRIVQNENAVVNFAGFKTTAITGIGPQ